MGCVQRRGVCGERGGRRASQRRPHCQRCDWRGCGSAGGGLACAGASAFARRLFEGWPRCVFAGYEFNHLYDALTLAVLCSHSVGYIITSSRSLTTARVGDTLMHVNSGAQPLPGFKAAKPMIFQGLFPATAEDYEVRLASWRAQRLRF